MSSSDTWTVLTRKRAQKIIARAPKHEQQRLRGVLTAMEIDPFGGDVIRLNHQPAAFRRRVGDWRIFFDVYPARRLVEIRFIERRTTTTYRRRK